uniref:Uncharacterized protein n=1 Tax=Gibberella zeae TaxID=5518 RepID=A0A4E9ELA3_GIBZA
MDALLVPLPAPCRRSAVVVLGYWVRAGQVGSGGSFHFKVLLSGAVAAGSSLCEGRDLVQGRDRLHSRAHPTLFMKCRSQARYGKYDTVFPTAGRNDMAPVVSPDSCGSSSTQRDTNRCCILLGLTIRIPPILHLGKALGHMYLGIYYLATVCTCSRDHIYESPESHAKLALAPQSSSASAWEAAPFLLTKSVANRTYPRGPGKLDFTCPRDEII